MNNQSRLLDIVYFDESKLQSLLCQFTEGVESQLSITEESSNTVDSGFKGAVGPVSGKLEQQRDKRKEISRTISPYHDQIETFERLSRPYLRDFSTCPEELDLHNEELREQLTETPLMKIKAWPAIEELGKLGKYAKDVNELTRAGTALSSHSGDAMEQLGETIAAKRLELSTIKDPGLRKKYEKELSSALVNLHKETSKSTIPEHQIECIESIASYLMPDVIGFRFLPDLSSDANEIICSVNEEYFVNGNFETFLFNFGMYPNTCFEMLGLITDVPGKAVGSDARRKSKGISAPKDGDILDSPEFIESAFRTLFPFIESMFQYKRLTWYPRILVSPIAIYKSFGHVESL